MSAFSPLFTSAPIGERIPKVHGCANSRVVCEKKRHYCEVCGKCFTRERDVTRHLNDIHLRETLFFCPYSDCSSRIRTHGTAQESNLKWHINNIHTHERLFTCDAEGCDYDSYDPSCISRHRAEVHGFATRARKPRVRPVEAKPVLETNSRLSPYPSTRPKRGRKPKARSSRGVGEQATPTAESPSISESFPSPSSQPELAVYWHSDPAAPAPQELPEFDFTMTTSDICVWPESWGTPGVASSSGTPCLSSSPSSSSASLSPMEWADLSSPPSASEGLPVPVWNFEHDLSDLLSGRPLDLSMSSVGAFGGDAYSPIFSTQTVGACDVFNSWVDAAPAYSVL